MSWAHTWLIRLPILFASALHLLWTVLLLFWPDSINATAIFTFSKNLSNGGTALLFTAVSTPALGGILSQQSPTSWWRGVLLLPQQNVLTISACASMVAILEGRYADGAVRSWSFILADQAPYILLAIFYTIAMFLIVYHDYRTTN